MKRFTLILAVLFPMLVGCSQEPMYLECQTRQSLGYNERFTVDLSEKTVSRTGMGGTQYPLDVYESQLIWSDARSTNKLDRFSLKLEYTLYPTGEETCNLLPGMEEEYCYMDTKASTWIYDCMVIGKKF